MRFYLTLFNFFFSGYEVSVVTTVEPLVVVPGLLWTKDRRIFLKPVNSTHTQLLGDREISVLQVKLLSNILRPKTDLGSFPNYYNCY